MNQVTIIEINHPGDWNPHADTEQGQFTYRLRRIEAHKYDGHAEKVTAEITILDTSDTLADVQDAAARLINPQGTES